MRVCSGSSSAPLNVAHRSPRTDLCTRPSNTQHFGCLQLTWSRLVFFPSLLSTYLHRETSHGNLLQIHRYGEERRTECHSRPLLIWISLLSAALTVLLMQRAHGDVSGRREMNCLIAGASGQLIPEIWADREDLLMLRLENWDRKDIRALKEQRLKHPSGEWVSVDARQENISLNPSERFNLPKRMGTGMSQIIQ